MEKIEEEAPSARELVEEVGFGLAHLRLLVLGSGIHFVDGIEITMVNCVTLSTAISYGLGNYEKSFLATAVYLGLGVGCIIGGLLGDAVGRRAPIIASYAGVAVFGVWTGFADSYLQLLILRALVGLSAGIGMPPSQAMQSELTPDKMKMFMMMGRGLLFSAGCIFATSVVVISDPSLVHLDLRFCFIVCAVPQFLFCAMAVMYLPESPIFLAMSGDAAGAQTVFHGINSLNAFPLHPRGALTLRIESMIVQAETETIETTGGTGGTGEGEAEMSANAAARTSAGVADLLWLQLRTVMNPLIFPSTVALLLTQFALALTSSAHTYAEPLVLIAHATGLPPGWQILCEGIYTIPGCILVWVLDGWLERKKGLISCLVPLGACVWIFGMTVSLHSTWLVETLMQVAVFTLRLTSKAGLLFLLQVGSDIFPTYSRATGTGVGLVAARVGSTMAPTLYELAFSVTNCQVAIYHLCAALLIVSAGMVAMLLPRSVQECLDAADAVAAEELPASAQKKKAK